jgi:tyrosyl-tRNA synthetase
MKDPNKHNLYAIDQFWTQLQQKDNWFLINPLTVVQRSGYSDIEKKHRNYREVMTELDKSRLFQK